MEHFEIIKPSHRFALYIKEYWFLRTSADECPEQRLIPNGCVSMIFHRAEPMRETASHLMQPRGFVGGLTSKFKDYTLSGAVDIVCILFRPFGAAAFLAEPMGSITDRNIEIGLLGVPCFSELQERIYEAKDNRSCVELIESTLSRTYLATKEFNLRRMAAAVEAADRGVSETSYLAAECCLSTKQFRRLFIEYVGINPSEFVRIVRFQRALDTMDHHAEASFTKVAHECGFADQAHFNREFRLFSGYSPSEYLSICAPYSDYFA